MSCSPRCPARRPSWKSCGTSEAGSIRVGRSFSLLNTHSPYYLRASMADGWYQEERIARVFRRWRWSKGDATMVVLRERLDDARGSRGRFVTLFGESGVGKSRTAEELARHAASLGVSVYEALSHESPAAPPFRLWSHIARAHATRTSTDALTHVIDALVSAEVTPTEPLTSVAKMAA